MTDETPIERLRRRFDEGIDPTDAELLDVMRSSPPTVVAARVRQRRKGKRTSVDIDRRTAANAEELASLARWLPGGANRGGRTDQRAERLADYRTAILALSENRYSAAEITATRVLERLYRTGGEAQLRHDVSDPEIGGWKRFRAEVLRVR